MRWRPILLILLALLSLGAIAFATEFTQRERDAVTITQTVLMGDPAAAEGLVLQWHGGTDLPPLRWDITYRVGGQPSYESKFSPQRSGWTHVESYPASSMDFDAFPSWFSGEGQEYTFHYSTLDLRKETGFMARPVKAILAEMAPETDTQRARVRVADYYDSYHLYGSLYDLTDRNGANEAAFQAYFAIPVPEDLWLDFTVYREPGSLRAVFHTPPPEGAPALRSAVVGDTVYYYFLPTAGGLDSSLLPQGTGIYAAPYREKALPRIDATALSLVYPLPDPGGDITYFRPTEDEAYILLVTRQEGVQTVSLLRREGMETVARATLPPEAAPLRGIYQVPGEGESYLAVFEDDSFRLLVPEAQGELVTKIWDSFSPDEEAALTEQLDQLSPGAWPAGEPRPLALRNYILSTAAYDGERLAILRKNLSTQALFLQVFDGAGTVYLGRYDSSLTAFHWDDQESFAGAPPGERAHENLSKNYCLTWQPQPS